jgi:hypothetical protein
LTANLMWNPGIVPVLRNELRLAKPKSAHAFDVELTRILTPSKNRIEQCSTGFRTRLWMHEVSRKVGWSLPPSIIATRRLKLAPLAGLQSLHLAQPAVLA